MAVFSKAQLLPASSTGCKDVGEALHHRVLAVLAVSQPSCVALGVASAILPVSAGERLPAPQPRGLQSCSLSPTGCGSASVLTVLWERKDV